MKGGSLIAWGLLVSLLAVGLPLFLPMPLWTDVTLYDIAARNVLSEASITGMSLTPTPPAWSGSMGPSVPCWGGGRRRCASLISEWFQE
jgi:hypothetical protein